MKTLKLHPRFASVILLLGLSFVGLSSTAARADVNDFEFKSFTATYDLSLASDSRVSVAIDETLVALFPEFDQNRGIRRDIPLLQNGVPLRPEIQSITDSNGNARSFETTEDGEFLQVTIAVPEGEYVHGEQTYRIRYLVQDPIRSFASSSGFDEFYWDINGNGWAQPFGQVSATVNLDSKLAAIFQVDQAACYQGDFGANNACESLDKNGTSLRASATNLQPGETLTVDLPFTAGLIAQPKLGYFDHPLGYFQVILVGLGFALLVWSIWYRVARLANAKGRPFVIPEYLPPKNLSIAEGAVLMKQTAKLVTSGTLQLAIAGYLKIGSEGGKHWFAIRTEKPAATGYDGGLLDALFGAGAATDDRVDFNAKDTRLAKALRGYLTSSTTQVKASDLYRRPTRSNRWLAILVMLAVTLGALVSGIALLSNYFGQETPLAVSTFSVIFAVVFFALLAKKPLSSAGSEARDHIMGLHEYIELAEADRLKVLQSPQGAIKEPVKTNDRETTVKLYEKVLPWAALLGLEKQWARVLEVAYASDSPTWIIGYPGNLAFAASLGSFANQASALGAASSTSSGAGGGGSAGGGGGGGGGGGV